MYFFLTGTRHLYPGVILGNGDMHTAVRKFSIGALREFGVGKRTIEERIQEESRYLCDVIQEKKGNPSSYIVHFKEAVSNIIASIVYGTRFDAVIVIFIFLNDP